MSAALFEVTSRTSMPPGRDDARWFDVTVSIGGIPITQGRFTTDRGDRSGRLPADSMLDAERKARALFGAHVSRAVNPRPSRLRRAWRRVTFR